MPPNTAEVAKFLADKSPEEEAWRNLVDSALASPRYGERIGRRWLDVVRFAESNGFETNRERQETEKIHATHGPATSFAPTTKGTSCGNIPITPRMKATTPLSMSPYAAMAVT